MREARAAESGVHAERVIAAYFDTGAAGVGTLAVDDRAGVGCFGAIEAGGLMRPVAKRFIMGLTAAAEQVRFLGYLQHSILPPGQWFSVLRDDLGLMGEGNVAGDLIRSIGKYRNSFFIGHAHSNRIT